MMQYPGVGTGVYVRRSGKLLFGLRKSKAGTGSWCVPGGKLEMFETWEACAYRETKEETGLEIDGARVMTVTDDMNLEIGTHFATVHLLADWKGGEAKLVEPDKFERWEWFPFSSPPQPLFWPTGHFFKLGINPFDLT